MRFGNRPTEFEDLPLSIDYHMQWATKSGGSWGKITGEFWREGSELGGLGGTLDPELLKSISESVGMEAERFCCSALPFDAPLGILKDLKDVSTLDVNQATGACATFCSPSVRLQFIKNLECGAG